MSNEAQAMRGKVSGVGVVKDKDGNIKGYIKLEGETPLSEAELRERLNLPADSVKTEEEKG